MRLIGRGKIAVALALVVALIGIVAIAGVLWLNSIGVYGGSNPGEAIEVVVPPGATIPEIGEILEQAGVIESATGFRIAAAMDDGPGIQAGRYEVPTGLSARDALERLRAGPLPREYVTVTFREGAWLEDFAEEVAAKTHISHSEFEAALDSGITSKFQPPGVDSLEGLMFPSTYQVVEDNTAEELVKKFVAEFDERVAALDRSKIKAMGYSVYEAVIVASMVELEAKHPEERGKIARVIYNRLEDGGTLGIDATVQYALGERKADLTVSDLAIESPYNTRTNAGLPPTPIAASGLESLEAAFDPPEGDWFYYVVSDCDGRHAFSTTAEEFAADKAAYQALTC